MNSAVSNNSAEDISQSVVKCFITEYYTWTNKDGNYAFPIRAARVTVTAGTGTATMTLLQGLR